VELAGLLYVDDDLDGVRALADAGVEGAASYLADLLAHHGDVDGLRTRADAGEEGAAWRLGELLAKRGDLDGLRALAIAGDKDAARRPADLLVGLLADRGDLEGAIQVLRARADVGDGDAWRLAELLIKQGRGEEAERLRRFGLNPDGSIASA
jgi:hypothetical protein